MTTSERYRIIEHLLTLVPFDGWTEYAFTQAAKRAGISNADAQKTFPGGVKECMAYFFAQEDAALAGVFRQDILTQMRIPQRIESLVLWRLNHMLPHREAVRRAIAWKAMPWNTLQTTSDLYHTVDLIWRLAGDTSTDFSYYTKRMTLAAVYSATLLYWLDDTSNQQTDTVAFLKRRLDNVASFGKWKHSVASKFS